MDVLEWFRRVARYNQTANERLYRACGDLPDSEYRRARPVSFGSVHALLNHILLGDRIWMARFEGGGAITPPLDTVLYLEFPELRAARVREDERIVAFFDRASDEFLSRPLRYANSKGVGYADNAAIAAGHFFNHQTHHRGQIHVLLAESGVTPPSLDLHRILNP